MVRKISNIRARRRSRQTNTREDIIVKASELFSERGYLETSMEDIALAAGVSKGAIYHYFTGKTEILFSICSDYVEFDVEHLEQGVNAIQPGLEQVRYIISRHINHYASHVHAAKALINEAYNLSPKYYKKVKEKERAYYRIVAGVLSAYLGPQADKGTVTSLAFTLFGMCNWIFSWYDPRGAVSPARLSTIIFDVFTKGISGMQESSRSASRTR
jgi:AcrR family transcriptional regulator